jgi:hypothetical protein
MMRQKRRFEFSVLGLCLFFIFFAVLLAFAQETKPPVPPASPSDIKKPEMPKPPQMPKPEAMKTPDMKRPVSPSELPSKMKALEEKVKALEERVKVLEGKVK